MNRSTTQPKQSPHPILSESSLAHQCVRTAVFWLAVLAAGLGSITQAKHVEVLVSANVQWTDTGLDAIPGQSYLIHDAIGRWSTNTNDPAMEGGPDGFPYPGGGSELFADGRIGNLIGFIGENPVGVPTTDPRLFSIGSRPISLGGRSARLWLGFNDRFPADNGGSVVVQIDLEPLVPTYTDCADIPGIVARWRAEGNVRDSVGSNHGVLLNTNIFSSYYTNGQSCRAFYFNGNGGAALIPPARALEFEDGEDFTFDTWIKIDTGALAYTGNLVLLDRRSPPYDKFYTNPDGSFVLNGNGDRIKEGELSVGYLFSLFRQGNSENGRWLVECQINSRERLNAGLINTNLHSTDGLTPTLEDPRRPSQLWHHVAVSVRRNDTNGGSFYVDGRPAGNFDPTPFAGDLTPTTEVPLRLALNARDGYFRYQYRGAMDDMSIYRRALSAEEIKRAYEAGREGACCRNVGLVITNPPLVELQTPFDARVRVTRTFGRPPGSIVITNDIPPGLKFLSAVPQVGTTTNIGRQVLWYLGSLGNDESVSMRLRLSAQETNIFRLTAAIGYAGGADDDSTDDQANSVVESSGVPKCEAPSGLLGWWPGNSSPQDIVSTNSGTLDGGVEYTAAVVRSGFLFNGISSALRVGDPPAFHVQDLTLEAWIRRGSDAKATASGSGGFFFAGDTGGYGFGMLDDGRLMLSDIGLSFVPSSVTIPDTNLWHHVAVTKVGTNVVFYIDGSAVTRTNLAGRFIFNRPFALGALGGVTRNVFLGGIDELALYGRALEAAEINGIYRAGAEGKCRTGLRVDENPDNPVQCTLRYDVEEFAQDKLVFLTNPDAELELQISTNLVNWTSIRRIANAAGEIRGLINPTNNILYYRVCRPR